MSVVLITGGDNSGVLKYAEIFNPVTRQDALCHSFLREDMITARMEDLSAEEELPMLSRPLVSNGALPLATGPSHTCSSIGDVAIHPGPLPQGCISWEVGTMEGRQRK